MPNIAISGLGAIGPFGQGVDALKDSLFTGQSYFTKSPSYPELDFPIIMAPIIEFDFRQTLNNLHLPKELLFRAEKAGRRAPLTIQTSILSALEAWQNAKLTERSFDPERVGIVVAGNNTSQGYQARLKSSLAELSHLSPSYSLQFMDTDQIGTLTEILDIHGESFTVGGASASGNVAIIQAYRLIKQNILDICLVLGVLADLSALEFQGFYNIGALGGRKFKEEPDKACRPFDEAHEGFILGQASGCLILESSSGEKSGVPQIGYLRGIGFFLDGNRGAEPSLVGEIRATKQALQHADLQPSDIDYINTHGSSSPLGDVTEISAISSVFVENLAKIWLNSTKGIIGHCLWSAGVLEAIATILQMNNEFLHPNLNLVISICQKCRLVGTQSIATSIKTAMSHSFGFGGINTSIILTKEETKISKH